MRGGSATQKPTVLVVIRVVDYFPCYCVWFSFPIPLFEMCNNKLFHWNMNFMLGLCRSRISCWRCCRDDWNSHFRLRSRDWGYFRIFRDWFNRTKSCQTFNSSKSNQRNGGWFENKQVSKFKFKSCSLLSKKLIIKNSKFKRLVNFSCK